MWPVGVSLWQHGRVAMLAALGFLVGEQFHPLFGGDIDVPSYIAFQQTPLQTFWQSVLYAIGAIELFSVASFEFPLAIVWRDGKRLTYPQVWMLSSEAWTGKYTTFDPLGLAPSDPAALKKMQTKELNVRLRTPHTKHMYTYESHHNLVQPADTL